MARNALQIGGADSDNPLSAAPWTIPDPSDPTAPMPQGAAVTRTASAVDQWMEAQRQKSAAMGLWNDQTGLPTGKGLLDAIQQTGTAVALGTGAPGEKPPPGFTVYHGSPHLFPPTADNPLGAFSDSAIGTGEGAQAYGMGHYTADAEGVARGYRDALTPKIPFTQTVTIGGKPLADLPEFQALNARAKANVAWALGNGASKDEWLAHVQSSLDDTGNSNWSPDVIAQRKALYQPGMDFVKSLDPAQVSVAPQPKGHMYEVQVNADPEHFLHWDKPLSEQSQHVRDALTGLGVAPKFAQVSEGALRPVEDQIQAAFTGTPLESAGRTIAVDASHGVGNWDLGSIRSMLDPAAATRLDAALGNLDKLTSPNRPEAWAHLTGQDALDLVKAAQPEGVGEGFQQALGKATARDVATSQVLQKAGIPGIRYLDQGSRGAGDGTHNVVVFSPEIMNIIRRYGLAGLMAGGGAAALSGNQQQPQSNPLLQ